MPLPVDVTVIHAPTAAAELAIVVLALRLEASRKPLRWRLERLWTRAVRHAGVVVRGELDKRRVVQRVIPGPRGFTRCPQAAWVEAAQAVGCEAPS